MNFSFADALAAIGEEGVQRVAAAARPPGDYLFATILPERNLFTYHVTDSSMTIRSTMAGLVGMDSPYPMGGAMEVSTFMERTAKLANENKLSEEAIRTLQDMLMRLRDTQTSLTDVIQREALNFLQKIIIQPHLDVMEWLRGQALVYGEIDWTFNQKNLLVNYGVPAGNFLTPRAGVDGYGGTASKFWEDVRAAKRMLRGGLRGIIGHGETIDMIRYNEANAMAVIAEGDGSVTFRRWQRNFNGDVMPGQFSADAGDVVTLIAYDREGEILNPADTSTTLKIPFMPRGKLAFIGNNLVTGYVVGQGATEDPDEQNELGYTHIAPTVENGGQTGRWAELYIPERAPWSLHGRGVTNGLPVLTAPDKLVVATTDMV